MDAGWRQSLGAGLLLGLALGCTWLAHWAPQLTVRIILILASGLLTLLGAALMLSFGAQGWSERWRRRLEAPFSSAGVPFFALLIILTVAAITSGNNLLYLLVSGLLAALAISGLAGALNLSGMVLRFRLPEEIFAGEPVTVAFTLSNDKGFWPAYSLTVQASAASSMPAAAAKGEPAARTAAASPAAAMAPAYFAYLARRQHITSSSQINFPRRGVYTATAFALNSRFPFGLLNQRRRFQSEEREADTVVYPKPAALPDLAGSRLRQGQDFAREGRGDSLELYRIRPLQPGDSARQVYWKASARAGELRVREFSREQSTRLRLRMALAAGIGPEAAEAAISLCAGWLLTAEREDCWVEFLGDNAPGLWRPLAPARQHHSAVLSYLARLDAAAPWAALPGRARRADPACWEIEISGPAAGPLVSVVNE